MIEKEYRVTPRVLKAYRKATDVTLRLLRYYTNKKRSELKYIPIWKVSQEMDIPKATVRYALARMRKDGLIRTPHRRNDSHMSWAAVEITKLGEMVDYIA